MNILLVFPGFIVAFIIVLCYKCKIRRTEPANRVHFYAARDESGELYLYLGKPIRVDNRFSPNPIEGIIALGCGCNLQWYGLNENNYKNLKWEDEPLEVFVNMED